MNENLRLFRIFYIAALAFAVCLSLLCCAGAAGAADAGEESAAEPGEIADTTSETDSSTRPEPESKPTIGSDSDVSDEKVGVASAGGASAVVADDPSPAPAAEPREAEEETAEASALRTRADDDSVLRGSDARSDEGMTFIEADTGGESGLSAGLADDNEQYGYFVDFLKEYGWAKHLDLDVRERIVFRVRDSNGDSVPNALVIIEANGTRLESGRTLADGSYQFNPSLYARNYDRYDASISGSAGLSRVTFPRSGRRTVEIEFSTARDLPQSVPVDIVFVMDTTGSMGEEIDRLKRTIELIHLNLTSMSVPTELRLGLVLYKDIGDSYRTRTVPLNSNLASFQADLDTVRASGGGDTPEDLQAALEETVTEVNWNDDGVRLAFIVTDAPPHLDYEQPYNYTVAARDARALGLKIFSIGTGGLNIHGEYILRQIAQFTGGAYIFLTYGETGESEGGAPGSVSHHTGANYQTDKLESIIIRLAKEELSYLTDEPIDPPESYFSARKLEGEERERTLAMLFERSVDQLADFSTIVISSDSRVAVLPIETGAEDNAADAEYFTEQLVFAASRSERVAIVERRNLQELLEEQKIQLSGLTDSDTVTKIGEIMNAEILLLGTLHAREAFELFLKFVRVETGEVLSVTKAVIESELGISDGS